MQRGQKEIPLLFGKFASCPWREFEKKFWNLWQFSFSLGSGDWKGNLKNFRKSPRGRNVSAALAKSPLAALKVLTEAHTPEATTFLEQDSTTVPKSAYLRFCPFGKSCWGVPSPNPAMRHTPLEKSQKFFFGFSKAVPLHTLLREFIEKIVVHECSYDENGTRRPDIAIYYSFVGKVELPDE